MENKYSPGGSKIYRYSENDLKNDLADLDSPSLEEIDAHITRHLGEPSGVFHELFSPNVHIDVHIVPPTPERNFYTLVTSGMSDKPMNSPIPEARFAELVIMLPPDWKLDQDSFQDEANYWPVRQLKSLARFPHEFSTWIWAEHTIPNGDPPEPYAVNTGFCGMLISYPLSLPPEFYSLKISEEKEIFYFSLIPLFKDEMDFKLQSGVDALYKSFDKAGVGDVVNVLRSSSVQKSWFGKIFR